MSYSEWDKKRIFIILPAYNVSATIGKVLEKLRTLDFSMNVVVVNDGSQDDTPVVARMMGATVLSHSRNIGKGAALTTGFNYCKNKADIVVTLDADNQHDPGYIPVLLAHLVANNVDMVIGRRQIKPGAMPWPRAVSNFLSSLIVSIRCGQKIPDSQSGFRAMRAQVLYDIYPKTHHFDTESEILIEAAQKHYKIDSVAVDTTYFRDGSTSMRPLIDTFRFIMLIIKSLFW